MHAGIRLLCFITLVGFVAQASVSNLILAGVFSLPLFYYAHGALYDALKMAKRLRWFFLSIAIFYLGFTDGGALYQGAPDWLPTLQGVEGALSRVAALLLVVGFVATLVRPLPQAVLLAAILWLLKPLEILGLNSRSVAVKLHLTIDYVGKLPEQVNQYTPQKECRFSPSAWADTAVDVIGQGLSEAEKAPLEPVLVTQLPPPPWYQWLYPVLIFGIFSSL